MEYALVEKPKAWHHQGCSTAKIWPWIAAEKCSECQMRQEAAMKALRARLYQQESIA